MLTVNRFYLRVAALLAALMCMLAFAQDNAPIPPLASRVTDAAGILGADGKQALEAKLTAFEQATGGQLAVLIVKTAEPETIDQYGIRVGEAWKIGKKGKDTGAILIVAMKEKKLRIEVGYGWEGALPDVEAKRIISETITPFFKKSQFAQGIEAGIDKIQLAVSKENKAAATTVNDKGQWEQSHNATTTESTLEELSGMAPVLLGVLAVLSFILPALVVGAVAGIGTFFFTSALPAAGIAAFLGFVGASAHHLADATLTAAVAAGVAGLLAVALVASAVVAEAAAMAAFLAAAAALAAVARRVAGVTEAANESLNETRMDDSRRRQACAA